MLDDIKVINFINHGDDRGNLVAIESNRDVPFVIKRIFYIYGLSGNEIRGQHANRKSEFVMINLSGSCKIKALDHIGNERVYVLDKPNVGLYLPRMIWKEMYDFSKESVLMILSNEYYDSSEYIQNKDDFMKVNG